MQKNIPKPKMLIFAVGKLENTREVKPKSKTLNQG
jgi:hypothetical protein